MRKYELVIVLDGGITPAKKKSFTQKIEKLVKTFKGSIGKVNDWGKVELAYKIDKKETGNFLVFPLELGPEEEKQIDAKLRLDDEIVRYLIIKLK